MSKMLLKKRVFSEAEFQKATQIERIWIHLIEPTRFQLNYTDTVKLDRLQKTWAILSEHYTPFEQKKMIMATLEDVNFPNVAQQLIEEANLLFKGDRAPLKDFILDKYLKLAKMAEEKEDLETAKKCYDSIVKLERLDQPEDHKLELALPEIEWSDDPSALNPAQYHDFEEIEKETEE